MRRRTALAALVLLVAAGGVRAEEDAPDPLQGVLRTPAKVKAARAFLAAEERGDASERVRLVKDSVIDPWLLATYLWAGHVGGVEPGRPYLAAAERVGELVRAQPAGKTLPAFLARARALDGTALERERRLLRLVVRTSERLDAGDNAGLVKAVEEAEADLRGPAGPFAWLALGRAGSAWWGLGDKRRAAEVYARAAGVAEALEWPWGRADSLTMEIQSRLALEDYAAAAPVITTLAATHHALGAAKGEAMALTNLAIVERRLERLPAALATAERSIEAWGRVPFPGEQASARVGHALVLLELGRREEAAAEIVAALPALEAGAPPRDVARAHLSLGSALLDAGEHARALASFERALEQYERLADASGTGSALQNLGSVHRRIGDTAGAEALNRRAVDVLSKAGDRRLEGRARSNLGALLVSLGRTPEGIVELERALALAVALGDTRGAVEAETSLARGRLDGGEAAAAASIAERALARLPEGPVRIVRVHLLLLLGEAAAAAGDRAKATDAAERAFAEVEATADRSPVAARVYLLRAIALLEAGDGAQALALARRAFGIRRTAVHGFGEEEAAALRKDARIAAEIGFAAATRATGPKSAGALSEAFGFAEGARAALLAEGIVNRDALLSARLQPGTARLDRDSRAAVESRRSALLEALRRGTPTTDVAQARTDLSEAYRAREQVLARVRREAQMQVDLAWPEPVSLADARKDLGEHTALVLWQITRSRVFALVVRPTTEALVDAGDEAEMEREVTGWLRLVSTPDGAEAKLAERLYDRLVRPLEPHLAGVERLLISPDGALAFLPFDALLRRPDPGATGAAGAAERLLARYEVTLIPSATVLDALRKGALARPQAHGLLALGDPRYPPPGAGAAGPLAAPRPLPESRREVEAVAAGFEEGERTVLLGAEATVPAFERALAAHAAPWRAVHLACHAAVDADRPRLSGLVLSDGGVLDLDRVYGLDAKTDLVVLSACETGSGRLLAGEGVVGLVRGFFFAGATRVVASHWRVADDDARLLVERFYRHGRDLPPSQALRAAKLELLAERPHPYHWAAFSLWGLPD